MYLAFSIKSATSILWIQVDYADPVVFTSCVCLCSCQVPSGTWHVGSSGGTNSRRRTALLQI